LNKEGRKMKSAFLFQGQGSQLLGMGRDLYDQFETAKNLYNEANDILGFDLKEIIFNGPKDQLDLTINTQPALMLHSTVILKIIQDLSGKNIEQLCTVVAGHSLGEYTAACAAGAMEFADCLKLLRLRGQSMQNAVAVGRGAMAAILGVDKEEVMEIIQEALKFGTCDIANDNCPGQIVISGIIEAVTEAMNIAKSKGKKAIKLDVSAPFHCSLMEPVEDVMQQALEDIQFSAPRVPIIMNVTALPTRDLKQIKSLLVKQITSLVRWRETIIYIAGSGVNNFYEIGTGKVLVGVGKRIDENCNFFALSNKEAIEEFVSKLI